MSEPLRPVPPEKMRYLDDVRPTLRAARTPEEWGSHQRVEIEWLGGNVGRTRIREVELLADERAESTGEGHGVSPGHTFLAGFGFSHMTQWGRAAAACDVEVTRLTEEIDASFDRRGEYLFDEGYDHPGFTDIRFVVRLESTSPRERVRRFLGWAERSPPHATLRRAVRLVGEFHVNGRPLATATYHADRTEWQDHP